MIAPLVASAKATPSPQRRLGPQGVKSAVFSTRWGPSFRWDDVTCSLPAGVPAFAGATGV